MEKISCPIPHQRLFFLHELRQLIRSANYLDLPGSSPESVINPREKYFMSTSLLSQVYIPQGNPKIEVQVLTH